MSRLRILAVLAAGAASALASTMTLACNPSPLVLGTDGDLRTIADCPGFSVTAGSVSAITLSITLSAIFTSPGTAHTFTDTNPEFNPVTFFSHVSGSGFQTTTDLNFTSNRFSSPKTLHFSVTSAGVVNTGTVSSFVACYSVTYTYSGTGSPVGAVASGTCDAAGTAAANMPEPSTAWLILPGLLDYGITRLRRTSKTTSGSRP